MSVAHRIDCICSECGVAYEKRADRVRTPDYCSLNCRKKANRVTAIAARQRKCEVCLNTFLPRPNQLRAGQGRFCSQKCNQAASLRNLHSPETRRKAREAWVRNGNAAKLREKIGPKNKQWRGGRFKSAGYFWLREPGSGRSKAEHRQIMEAHLGRALSPDEIVHHINHDKTDNRIENLTVMSRAEHMKVHAGDVQAACLAAYKPRPQKLTAEMIPKIRELAANGEKHVAIAKQFGVTPTNISLIVKGRIWTHV